MKKLLSLILVVVLTFSLCACGKSAAVEATEAAIAGIGIITLDSGSAIEAAENQYNILSEKEKEKVENRLALVEAKSTFEILVAEEEERLRLEEELRLAEEAAIREQELKKAATVLLNGLAIAENKLSFVSKYAGNVNESGSRKFASSFITELKNALNLVDTTALEDAIPGISKDVATIKTNIAAVCDLLQEMGNTNSDKNVPRIKETALDTATLVRTLINGELSKYK